MATGGDSLRDGTARVWDAATGKALSEPMKHGNSVDSAQFSADGQRVVTASGIIRRGCGTRQQAKRSASR